MTHSQTSQAGKQLQQALTRNSRHRFKASWNSEMQPKYRGVKEEIQTMVFFGGYISEIHNSLFLTFQAFKPFKVQQIKSLTTAVLMK